MSADRLTDNRTGNPYYPALVRVDEGGLAELPNEAALSWYAGDRDDPDHQSHGA